MRHAYTIAGTFLLLLIFFFSTIPAALAFSANTTIQGMNITNAINYTQNFINKINDSGYLIFYPNLQASYYNLSRAENISKNNTPEAYAFLNKAIQGAVQQQQSINKYGYASFLVLFVLTIITSVLLYGLMQPKRSGKRRNGR